MTASRAPVFDDADDGDLAVSKSSLRPRDAATLILLDRRKTEVFVLMGRRHRRHVFMPGKFVFPGGRTDPGDGRVPVDAPLHPLEIQRLSRAATRVTATRARAIAMSAVRETYEEAGLLIGRKAAFATKAHAWKAFAENGVSPALDGLRFVARAITPPQRVRRFDTRFFAAWSREIALALPGGAPTEELEELVWLPLREALQLELPRITTRIIGELEKRLSSDPELRTGGPVPFYRTLHNRLQREIL